MNRNIAITTRYSSQKSILKINPETGACFFTYVNQAAALVTMTFKDINDAGAWIRKHGALGGFAYSEVDGSRIGRNIILFFEHNTIWNDGFWERSYSRLANRIDVENDKGDGNWHKLQFYR